MICDPIEVACDLRALRREIKLRHRRLRPDTVDDLVGRAALELVERGRKFPGRRQPRSRLIQFARLHAVREESGGRYSTIEFYPVDFTESDLAVPSFVAEAERLADRLSDESTEDQEAEWRALSVRERGERIAEACRLTATSIGPTARPWRGV